MADRGVDEHPGILGDILHVHSDRISQSQPGRRSPDNVIANLPAHRHRAVRKFAAAWRRRLSGHSISAA